MSKIPKISKLVIIGAGNVGKTSLLTSYLDGNFFSNYDPRNVVNCVTKDIDLQSGEKHQIEYWDVSGSSNFWIKQAAYKRAKCILFVYNITDEGSFKFIKNELDSLRKLYEEESHNFPKVFLAGNKHDSKTYRQVHKSNVQNFADENDIIFFETSVKLNIFVKSLFNAMLKHIVDSY